VTSFSYTDAVTRIGEGRTTQARKRLLVAEALAAAGVTGVGLQRSMAEEAAGDVVAPERFMLTGYGEIASRLGAATAAVRRAVAEGRR
jgi:hypothetical protein